MKRQNYYKDGMSNEDYHNHSSISKSQLDYFTKSPSRYEWAKVAPVDEEKLKTFDFGTAMHAIILEPDRFNDEYVCAPEVNRQTKVGKETWANFFEENQDKTILTPDDWRKIHISKESVMAHPVARKIFEAKGVSERSYFWVDKETGVSCRCRPDRELTNMRWFADVKTTPSVDDFHKSTLDYGYYVQDPFYSMGYEAVTGEPLRKFVFVVIAKTVECGRYPVDCQVLPDEVRDYGKKLIREELIKFANCLNKGNFASITTMEFNEWALRDLRSKYGEKKK